MSKQPVSKPEWIKKMMETHVKRVIQEEFKKFSGGVSCDEPPEDVLNPMIEALEQFGKDHDQDKFNEVFMPLLHDWVVGQLNLKGINYHES
jgi:hypothetical protein